MAQDTYVASSVVTSGATLTTLESGGIRGMLDLIIAANAALANPTTQATATATGGGSSGGALAAGTYFIAYTFVGPGGETTVGTSESAQLTVASGNKPRVTIPALPTGGRSINLYVTAVGGSAGTETLYATGITTTTFDLLFAAGTDTTLPAPPKVSTSGLATLSQMLHAPLNFQADRYFQKLSEHITSFIQGDGGALVQYLKTIRDYSDFFQTYKQLMDDFGTLVAAHPGTLSIQVTNTYTGQAGPKRTLS